MIPVLLLTGFLGSGKTTLLNQLLDSRPTEGPFAESSGKLALIVNEFGDVGIDGDLLPDEMTRQIEIKGGCICCRLDDDLQKTLVNLLETNPEVSALIIETTGIAEPLPISWTLAREELSSLVRLAAVITVVDALEHEKHRELSISVDAQVEYADLLVLTKLDVAGEEGCDRLEALLRESNQMAPIFRGTQDQLCTSLWAALDDPGIHLDRSNEVGSQEHRHSFQSAVVPIDQVLDFEILSEELEELPSSYIRIKGIARVVDGSSGSTEERMIAFHRVGARVSAEPAREGLETRMVAIGTHVDAEALSGCIAESVID